MKTIFFFLFAGMAICAQGQYDTIGKYPFLYHYNWPETGVYDDDSVYCSVCRTYYIFAAGPNTGFYLYDSALYRSFLGSSFADGYALYQHTDSPLEITGLAGGVVFVWRGCRF